MFVVANACTDGTSELVRSRFPRAHTIDAPNLGFAYGNNRALERTRARYALLINPDTEILDGTLAGLIASDSTPCRAWASPACARSTPMAGCCRRYAASPTRRARSARRLAPSAGRCIPHGRASACSTPPPTSANTTATGSSARSCSLRREALLAAGLLDERFFLYCEEPDLCLRVVRAGWRVRYLPQLTIRHHAGKGGVRPRMVAQETFARRQYARKHFGRVHRQLYLGALGVRHSLRAALPGRRSPRGPRAVAWRRATRCARSCRGPVRPF